MQVKLGDRIKRPSLQGVVSSCTGTSKCKNHAPHTASRSSYVSTGQLDSGHCMHFLISESLFHYTIWTQMREAESYYIIFSVLSQMLLA